MALAIQQEAQNVLGTTCPDFELVYKHVNQHAMLQELKLLVVEVKNNKAFCPENMQAVLEMMHAYLECQRSHA